MLTTKRLLYHSSYRIMWTWCCIQSPKNVKCILKWFHFFFFSSQLQNTAIHRLCPHEKNSCFEVLSTSEKSKHASGHHELTLWTWGGTWVLDRVVWGKVRDFLQLFPLLPPQIFGLAVDAHPYSWWGAGQRARVGKWKAPDCSCSPTHAPAVVVQHEAFEGPHKRFPTYESYFFKKLITSENRTLTLGQNNGK